MAAFLSPIGNGQQFFDNQGVILAGGQLGSYQAGTLTPIATYTTSNQAVLNSNPIILDSSGRPPQEIWISAGVSLKLVLMDKNSVVIATWDNLSGINDTSFSQSEWVSSGLAPTFISTTQFSVPGDQRPIFQVDRQVQASVSTGAVFGYVKSASFGAGVTTVTLIMTQGVLDSGLSAIFVGLLTADNPSVPAQFSDRNFWNYIINGRFRWWQMGTSLGAATGARYLADQWQSNSIGSTIAPSRQIFGLGQLPSNPVYYQRSVVASVGGASNYAILLQYIEDVRTLSGQNTVLAFSAKAEASKNIAVELLQNFGTGGSPSSTVTGIGVTTIPLTTAWTRFFVPVAIPSIVGATMGDNGDSSLRVQFWFDAGSDFNTRTNSLGQQSGTFDIGEVELKQGSIIIRSDPRSDAFELSLCERFLEKSFSVDLAPAQNVGTGGAMIFPSTIAGAVASQLGTISFRARKRKQPTMTLYNPSAANAQVRDTSHSVDCSASSVDASNDSAFSVVATGHPSTTIGSTFAVHWVADARF